MSRPPELAASGPNVADRAPAGGMALERPQRPVLDLSELPTVAFGTRALTTWGTMGFMLAEGMTLAILAASYLYLRRNFSQWPPAGTPLPDLLVPTANLVVLLLNVVAAKLWEKPATRLDADGVRRWLWVGTLLSLAATVLRWFELDATHTRWNVNAYGSAVWLLLITHGTLLLADFGETLVIALIFTRGRHESKHFVDAADNAFYTYFMVAIWVPLYVMLYLYPRWS
jgi:cytochrome c oxidase subunit 3